MAIAKTKSPHSRVNPIETASVPDASFARNTVKSVKSQLEGTSENFINQLLGIEASSSEYFQLKGEMLPGEAIDLRTKSKDSTMMSRSDLENSKPERKLEILGGIDYRSEIIHGSERLGRREALELDNRIQEILTELKRLIGSSSILKAEFAVISVEDKPVKAGKYYTNFFEWLLIEVKKIRMKVEDAGAWLSVMKSKKGQKNYGAMAKKHGTSFTLNNERTPATQTG